MLIAGRYVNRKNDDAAPMGLLTCRPYGAREKIYHGYWLLTCRPYGAREKIYHGYWLLTMIKIFCSVKN